MDRYPLAHFHVTSHSTPARRCVLFRRLGLLAKVADPIIPAENVPFSFHVLCTAGRPAEPILRTCMLLKASSS
jgi:hypothetical protein